MDNLGTGCFSVVSLHQCRYGVKKTLSYSTQKKAVTFSAKNKIYDIDPHNKTLQTLRRFWRKCDVELRTIIVDLQQTQQKSVLGECRSFLIKASFSEELYDIGLKLTYPHTENLYLDNMVKILSELGRAIIKYKKGSIVGLSEKSFSDFLSVDHNACLRNIYFQVTCFHQNLDAGLKFSERDF